MSDWKQKIEAQIAWLDWCVKEAQHDRRRYRETRDSLQALLDVAVATESALDLWDHGVIKQQAINDLFAALDKLREVGDE